MTSNEQFSELNDGFKSPILFSSLRKFNYAMAVLHLLQGLLMVILGVSIQQLKDFSIPLYTMYNDIEVVGGQPQSTLATDYLGDFKYIGVAVGSFLLISAIAHGLIAGPLYKTYVANLKRKMNPVRWFEYALSSSIMVALIAMLFGARELWVIILIFGANAFMNLFGHMMELHNENKEKVNWTAYIYGWIIGMLPWAVITFYFAIAAQDAANMPWFVPVIYVVEFLLFMSFAFNMLLQYKKVGPWKDYLYGERMYQILSLISKTLLAWLVFAGIMQPT